MLIDDLHHPFLHNAARVRTVNIDIDARCLILEPYARARRSPFSVFFCGGKGTKNSTNVQILRHFFHSGHGKEPKLTLTTHSL